MGGSSNKRSRSDGAWSATDHAIRHAAKYRRKEQTVTRQERCAVLTHETKEKKQGLKLKLHMKRVQRELETLKVRLETWDPVAEAEVLRKEEERQRKEMEEAANPTPKERRRRKGPETWKLKGAARPASEVYDFDTRYVDPHIKAHDDARAKTKRSTNVLAVHKGKLATDGPEVARDYLALLMQSGYLSEDARKYKQARSAWMECIELEGANPITTARESLMQMYLKLNKKDDAIKLGESLSDDSSVWIRYSLALVAMGRDHPLAMDHLRQAIRANPLCAYYLAFGEIFASAMEYTHEIDESDNEPESSLEEAIEYCNSGEERNWHESGGADKLRDLLQRAIRGQEADLTADDVDWNARLIRLEEECARRQAAEAEAEAASDLGEDDDDDDGDEEDGDEEDSEKDGKDNGEEGAAEGGDGSEDEDDEDDEDEDGAPVDLSMYIGMFRLAISMVEEEGFVVSRGKKEDDTVSK
jgi:tetratricopeptide (TPR) repeat protein